MPRPRKCRKVCRLPRVNEFRPAGGAGECVTLAVDEYETIRLMDNGVYS